jgi:hypothetical protein
MMVDPNRYKSLLHGVISIYKDEGRLGLYKGIAPSTLRGTLKDKLLTHLQ